MKNVWPRETITIERLLLITIHTKINEMFCLAMFQYHQINVVQIIDSLDPGLVVESIQMSHWSECKNNDPHAGIIYSMLHLHHSCYCC